MPPSAKYLLLAMPSIWIIINRPILLQPKQKLVQQLKNIGIMIIEKVHAREILDSRGNPTVEVEVTLESGVTLRFSNKS